jgi:hypothetical protein
MLKTIVITAALLVLAVLILFFGPLLTIWAVNTLFPVLAIPYTIETWFATILLGLFLRANVSVKKG